MEKKTQKKWDIKKVLGGGEKGGKKG